ncbi:hypothetical protein ACOKW7_23450 [Limnospira platensis CENA597]
MIPSSQLTIAHPQCLLVGGFPSRVMIPSSEPTEPAPSAYWWGVSPVG